MYAVMNAESGLIVEGTERYYADDAIDLAVDMCEGVRMDVVDIEQGITVISLIDRQEVVES